MVLHPVQDKMLGDGGALLILDEDSGLEPCEGVHHVENVRGSLAVSPVLLQINSEDMVEI